MIEKKDFKNLLKILHYFVVQPHQVVDEILLHLDLLGTLI